LIIPLAWTLIRDPAPEFHMWAIETAAGLSGPLSDAQLTAYLYGEPLNSTPGTTYAYSNDGYYLLARVIERAAEMPYIDWVNANVLAPIGIADAVVSATAFSGRRSNEWNTTIRSSDRPF